MRKMIFKHTLVSLCAIGMSVACSKKDAASAAVDAGSLSQCPNIEDVSPGKSSYYSLQNAKGTPAKIIEVGKDYDQNNRSRTYYTLSFNGIEHVVINGKSDMQPQGPTKQDGQSVGDLKANCSGGRFVVAGTGLDGQDVSLQIQTKADDQGRKGLLVNEKFYYLQDNTLAGAFKQAANDFKNAISGGATAAGANKPYPTGIPKDDDLKSNQNPNTVPVTPGQAAPNQQSQQQPQPQQQQRPAAAPATAPAAPSQPSK